MIEMMKVEDYKFIIHKYMDKSLDPFKYKIAGELIRRYTRFNYRIQKYDKIVIILPKKHLFNDIFIDGLLEKSVKKFGPDYINSKIECYYIVSYNKQNLILDKYPYEYKNHRD